VRQGAVVDGVQRGNLAGCVSGIVGFRPKAWDACADQSELGHGAVLTETDHEVVGHADPEELSSRYESLGELSVESTGRYFAGGVIVDQDDLRRACPKGRLEDVGWTYGDCIASAASHLKVIDETAMIVEQENPERLSPLVSESPANEAVDSLRVGARLSGKERLFDGSSRELGEGDELPRSGGTDPSDGAELGFAGAHEPGQSAECFEHVTCYLESSGSRSSSASQEKGEEGEIVEALRSSEIPL
jgi:hypothetical protein